VAFRASVLVASETVRKYNRDSCIEISINFQNGRISSTTIERDWKRR
jgi:hypothetical protein